MSICQTLYAASCPPTSFVHNTQIHTDTHTYTHSHALAQVVRDYNKILTTLDREERMLFNDRIRHLDRRIMPGVSKLSWVADKHALEFYYKEARR